jgi:hypothetical protein
MGIDWTRLKKQPVDPPAPAKTSIYHPHHPLHHLVLEEIEEYELYEEAYETYIKGMR